MKENSLENDTENGTTRRKFLKQLGVTGLTALLSGGLFNNLGRAETAGEFKIGVVTSLSGYLAKGGHITERGYKMWERTVNERGGIPINGNKYKVKLDFYDASSKPATAAKGTEKLISTGNIDFIFGPYASGVTIASAPICNKYQEPMITGSAESPLIWGKKPKWVFGTIPSADLIGPASLKCWHNLCSPEPKSIAIVGIDDPFSESVADGYVPVAKEYGWEIVHREIIPADLKDLSPVVTKVKAKNPDVFAFGGHTTDHLKMIKAMRSLNFSPNAWVLHYGVTVPEFIGGLGEDANYTFGNSVWTKDVPREGEFFGTAKEFADQFSTVWGHNPDYTEAASSATGVVFQEAVKSIGATPPLTKEDKAELRTALEEIKLETFYGTVDYAKEGKHYHCNSGLTTLSMQILGGKCRVVGPTEKLMLAEPTYPVPSWQER